MCTNRRVLSAWQNPQLTYSSRDDSIVKANFAREGITRIQGRARLVSADLVEVTPTDDAGQPNGDEPYTISAPHVALTLGGTPVVPSEGDVPGASLGITSDGFFALKRQPKRLLVCGAGYIACELSQVMNACATDPLTTVEMKS